MLLVYGVPVLFCVLLVGALGVPFLPTSLMVVAAGSFIRQGEMAAGQVLPVALLGVVLGDQLGFHLARRGGRALLARVTTRFGGTEKVRRAEALTLRWGGAGIFLSRWLLASVGPWINVSCGLSDFPWHQFLFWDLLGQTVWVDRKSVV